MNKPWYKIEEELREGNLETDEAAAELKVDIEKAKKEHSEKLKVDMKNQARFFEKALEEIGAGVCEPNKYISYENWEEKPMEDVKKMSPEEHRLYAKNAEFRNSLRAAREFRINEIKEQEAIKKVEAERDLRERKERIEKNPKEAQRLHEILYE